MITPVNLISYNYLLRFSSINGSVDQKLIRSSVQRAQRIHLMPYLNKCLYDKIIELTKEYVADPATGLGLPANAAYKKLVDEYILDALLYWVLVELYPQLVSKVDNSNIIKHVPTDSETLSIQEMEVLVHKERERALNFTNRMIKYLCDNPSLFPEYTNCSECQNKTNDPYEEDEFIAI